MPSSEARALRLLEHIADADSTWVDDLDGLGIDRDDIAVVLRDSADAGHIELEPRHRMRLAQAYPGSRLTSAGTRYVEEIRDQRASPRDRAQAARIEILLWLYDTEGHFPVTAEFLDQNRTYYGAAFTEKDTLSAAKHLLDLGLIKGPTSWQSQGAPLRAEITTEGRSVVEDHDGDPAKARAQAAESTIYNQHIHNPTGSIAQGDNATAITHQGLSPDDIQHLRETFTRGLDALDDPNDREDVELVIDDLMRDLQADTVDAEQVERRIGSLQRLARRIGNAALMAAASEGGKQALELLAGSL